MNLWRRNVCVIYTFKFDLGTMFCFLYRQCANRWVSVYHIINWGYGKPVNWCYSVTLLCLTNHKTWILICISRDIFQWSMIWVEVLAVRLADAGWFINHHCLNISNVWLLIGLVMRISNIGSINRVICSCSASSGNFSCMFWTRTS